jgi:hypothetical protein
MTKSAMTWRSWVNDYNYYEFSSERINRNDDDNTWDKAFPDGITVE